MDAIASGKIVHGDNGKTVVAAIMSAAARCARPG
jgi:hypothetical protein